MTKNRFYVLLQKFQLSLILLTIICLPWYVIRFSLGGIPLTLLEIIAWLAIAFWLPLIPIKPIRLPTPRRYWSLLAIAWLAVASLAVIVSPDTMAALGILKAYFILPVVFAFVLYQVIDTPKRLQALLLALVVGSLQLAALCLSQWLIGWPNVANHELSQGRSSAVFNSANAVGLAIGPTIALLTSFLIFNRTTTTARRGLGLLALVLLGLGLYTTHSDGSLVATIASICLLGLGYGLTRVGFNSARLWLGGSCLIIVYAVATIVYMGWFNHPPTVANPYTRPDFTTLTIRQCTWQGAWNSLQASPWLGNGLAGFSQSYLEHATCDAEPFIYPHNNILNFWTELGLAGLVLWLALVSMWIKTSADLIITNGRWTWIGWGSLAALGYWLVHGLVDVPYFKNDLAMLWWLLTAITVIAARLVRTNKT